jgi:type I restriction enzyme S subunit
MKIAQSKVKGKRKETVLGLIPNDWDCLTIEELAAQHKGAIKIGPFGSQLKKEEFIEKGMKVYDQETAFTRDFFAGGNYISKSKFEELKSCQLFPNDVIISMMGTIGATAIVPEDAPKGILNSHLLRVQVNSKIITPQFLSLSISESEKTINQIQRKSHGGIMAGLSAGIVKSIYIIVPPIKVQNKIVKVISAYHKALLATEKLILLKEATKHELAKKIFHKQIKALGKDWSEFTLSEVADKSVKWSITGGPFGSNLKAQDYVKKGVRIIQLQNIGDGEFLNDYKIYTSETKAKELLSCNIFPGEIILSKMGDPVARACIIPEFEPRYVMSSDGIRLVVDEKRFNKHLILHYINHEVFRRQALEASTGSTRSRIGLDDLKSLKLNLPPLKEQNKIARMLQALTREIDLLKSQYSLLENQKLGVLRDLLSGKLTFKN